MSLSTAIRMSLVKNIYDSLGIYMKKMKYCLVALCCCLSFNAMADRSSVKGDSSYTPSPGQAGKDVIWLPTGTELVSLMLKTANVTNQDLVYDLGAGDGKIAIAAAKEFGAKAVGIEFNPDMAAYAQRNAIQSGVGQLVKIIHGDIFVEDFSQATVVTLYLLPDLNMQLRPTILKMKPGTRVVSHAFSMGDWEADKEMDLDGKAYYWVVPADVAGEWSLEGNEVKKVTLTLAQRFQRIGGNIKIGDQSQPILNPHLEGKQLRFSYIDLNKNYITVKGDINGSEFKGEYKNSYSQGPVLGKRR
ncbi:class I SAM-dependent methyltransferase [Polynucleobacter arcticus]|uniref:Class I SAM-dependent methyltransferase n=2 Tax=Polynucleobacter arcticus TaxID=1743165 RepID=A0A6M9PRY7_9BURK|nr:class I SAM-dependent methyltransferase [Polynucleobacter arcticus]